MATADTSGSPIFVSKEQAAKVGISTALAERIIEGGHELQSIFQKLGVEYARSFPDLDGYDYWTIVDVGALLPQGLLDLFWRPKRSTPEYFKQFNGATVLLLRGLSSAGDDRVFTSGEKLAYTILCSNYAEQPIPGAVISWTLRVEERPQAQGRLPALEVPQGTVSRIGQIEFSMPEVNRPAEVVLHVEIEGTATRNEWRFYCFPKQLSPARVAGGLASQLIYRRLKSFYPALKPLLSNQKIGKPSRQKLVVTERLDGATLRFLELGGTVILLNLHDFSPVQSSFQLGRWGRWQPSNQLGTAFAAHPVFEDFPCAGGLPCLAWFRMHHDAVALSERWGNRVDPLMVTLGKESYLVSVFQARVGLGRLFASGLDLLSEKPEAAYLLDQFLRYVQSNRFEPERNLAPSDLRSLLAAPSTP